MWRMFAWMVILKSAGIGDETPPAPPAATRTSLPSEKTFEVEGPEEALRVAFHDLELRQLLGIKEIPVDVEGRLPEWLKNLNGKIVRIRGAMYPTPLESGLKSFLLVPQNDLMHFGRRLHVDERVGVRMRKETTTDYISDRQFDVVGKFTIKPRIRASSGLVFSPTSDSRRKLEH